MEEPRPLLARLRGPHLVAVDIVAAIVLTFVISFAAREPASSALEPTGPVGGLHEPGWVSVLIAAAIGLPIAVRRRWPAPVLGIVVIVSITAMLWGLIPVFAAIPLIVAVAMALYLVAVAEPRPRAVAALMFCLVVPIAVVVLRIVLAPDSWSEGGALILVGSLVTGASWATGRAARARQVYLDRSAHQLAAQAVTEERLRIARELHDIVAHSLSVIAVKAGIANHVARERPAEASDALRVIEETSRGTLAEMRQLLGVLRSETEPDVELAPSPGLAGLPDLAKRARMAGVDVELSVPDGAALPEGVELSVYRIVQEALTNVVKHAAPAHARVAIETDGGEVRIEIIDDGVARSDALPGMPNRHGLIGMRERVMMYDGTFTAGPRAEGGFAVSASLPYRDAS